MRNSFNLGEKTRSVTDPDAQNAWGSQASSPDQLALVWNGGEEAVVASPARSNVSASGGANYAVDIARVPANFKLQRVLQARRESQLGLPALSADTRFLTSTPYFSERTRILALDPEVLAFDDFHLTVWLVNAEKQMVSGIDNHPLFESALEDTACSITRLPNGKVAMTEVPRHHVQAARDNLRSLLGDAATAAADLTIETPLRCAARQYLTATAEGAAALASGRELEVTAFILLSEAGFSYGLWSPAAGLFSEYAFLAPTEINKPAPSDGAAIYESGFGAAERSGVSDASRAQRLGDYFRHAFDQLSLQLSPDKLNHLGLSRYARVVWLSSQDMTGMIEPVADEYADQTGIEFFRMPAAVEEAVAGGLLFGSFGFGADVAAGAKILPPVNLIRDLLALADKEEVQRRQIEAVRLQNRRSRAVFSILAVPTLALACLLAFAASIVFTQIMSGIRASRADEKASELKPALDRRKSYEANLKWYQEFITQVSRLRRQQPAGISLQYQLNSHYPFALDPSFYVSDLKLLTNGTVEIKGLARNKDAVTSFLRGLEFAGGAQSGSKLFSNLTYEVQEGTPPTPAGQNLPPGMSSTMASNLAPGVVAWSMKGVYVPMVEFIPPDPKKKPAAPEKKPAASPATAASPTSTP